MTKVSCASTITISAITRAHSPKEKWAISEKEPLTLERVSMSSCPATPEMTAEIIKIGIEKAYPPFAKPLAMRRSPVPRKLLISVKKVLQIPILLTSLSGTSSWKEMLLVGRFSSTSSIAFSSSSASSSRFSP